jgi:hypothetical protein
MSKSEPFTDQNDYPKGFHDGSKYWIADNNHKEEPVFDGRELREKVEQMLTDLVNSEISREREEAKGLRRRDGGRQMAIASKFTFINAEYRALIQEERAAAVRELFSKLEDFMRPATHASGAHGLPKTDSVVDWEYHITKAGWDTFKATYNQEKEAI